MILSVNGMDVFTPFVTPAEARSLFYSYIVGTLEQWAMKVTCSKLQQQGLGQVVILPVNGMDIFAPQ